MLLKLSTKELALLQEAVNEWLRDWSQSEAATVRRDRKIMRKLLKKLYKLPKVNKK